MDINNIQALIAQGLITDVASVDPNKAYVAVGVFQPGNRQSGSGNNTYPSYAMPISEFLAAGGIYTASNGIALVGNDFQLASLNISQFTNDAGYLTSAATNDLDPVISQTNIVPGSPTLGDRYLAGTAPAAPWTANSIEEWDGASWITTSPVLDDVVFVTATLSTLRYNGTAWVAYAGTAVLNQGNTTGSALVIGTNTAQALVFKTNNIESARVVSGGSWGFGTITPSAKVTIKGQTSDSSTLAFDIRNSSNTLIASFRNDGNVGIGTNTPAEKLEIYDNVGDSILKLSNSSYTGASGIVLGNNLGTSGQFIITNNGFTSYGAVKTDITALYSGRDLVLMADNGNSIVFATGGSPATEKMILLSSGNLGLGVTSPTARVHVQGVDSTALNYALKVDNSASSPLLYVKNDGHIFMNSLPTSNAGLSTGELYISTAATILANGDKVVGWKV